MIAEMFGDPNSGDFWVFFRDLVGCLVRSDMFTVTISGKSLLQPPPVVPATTPPIQTPGFGAFIAHAGLGAVALPVLRRN